MTKYLDLRRAALLLFSMLALLLLGSLQRQYDTEAEAHVRKGLERALTTFATARTLGAVISVAQGTVVDVQPGGVGMSFAPGQALQPINELIDHFADLMLAASVAFGIQLLLLKIGSHVLVSCLLAATVIAWTALRWSRRDRAAAWLQPLLVALVLLRLALPLGAIANEALYDHFMADGYSSAWQALDHAPTTAQPEAEPAPPQQANLLDRISNWLPGLPAVKADIKARYDKLQQAAAGWSRHMVDLIAIFLVQTVVVPLGFLWLALRLARQLGSAPWRGGDRAPQPSNR